jgi:hypothetical protein
MRRPTIPLVDRSDLPDRQKGISPRLVVRVVEEAAAYRRGLEAAFVGAGHRVSTDDASDVVLVSHRDSSGCEQAVRWAQEAEVTVVALITPADAPTVAHAFGDGVHAVADWEADPERIVEVAEAAYRGDVMLPLEIARELPGAA